MTPEELNKRFPRKAQDHPDYDHKLVNYYKGQVFLMEDDYELLAAALHKMETGIRVNVRKTGTGIWADNINEPHNAIIIRDKESM